MNPMSSEVTIIFLNFFPVHSSSFLSCVKCMGAACHHSLPIVVPANQESKEVHQLIAGLLPNDPTLGTNFLVFLLSALCREGFGGNFWRMTTVRQGTLGDLAPRDTNPWTFPHVSLGAKLPKLTG